MSTTTPARPAPSSSPAAPHVVDPATTWAMACLNCGAALVGSFCAHCGQRAVPPNPTFRELVGDAFAEFSGWDGRFAATIRALLLHPGRLTLEFLEGRRVQYVAALRLYLTASLVYFALSAASPNLGTTSTSIGSVNGPKVTVSKDGKPTVLTEEDRQEIEKKKAEVGSLFRPVLQRVEDDPVAFRNDVFNSMPKALFFLLPVFAGILKLFYPKRRFAGHLYFALHVHAFTFAALSLGELVKFTHLAIVSTMAGIVVLLGVPFYWHRALRRVYGGSLGATLLKEVGIGTLYSAASIPALIALAVWIARG